MPITAETAKEMALKSHEQRRKNAQENRNLVLMAEQSLELASQAAQLHMQKQDVASARVIEYEQHLRRLKAMLGSATETTDIFRLTQAIAKLEEVYCQYANIPKPGQLKPASPRLRRQIQSFDPIEPTPPQT